MVSKSQVLVLLQWWKKCIVMSKPRRPHKYNNTIETDRLGFKESDGED